MPNSISGLKFDAAGRLPPGIHDCVLNDLKPLVATNPHRLTLWSKLTAFLASPLLAFRFEHAYVGGSFLSSKPNPDDVDLVLHVGVPYGPEAFRAIEPFFAVGLPVLREIYSVHLHFWLDNAPKGLTDFRSFFQYQRSDDKHESPSPERRGMARIDLTSVHGWQRIRCNSNNGSILPLTGKPNCIDETFSEG